MNELTLILKREPDEADNWLADPAVRRTFIGASDAAAVLGVDPYRSPTALWLEKTGRAEGFAGNAATDWGHRLEPVIAEWVADARPEWSILDPGGMTYRHLEHEWMACTPDRVVLDPERGWGNLQIKTAGWRAAEQWATGDAPDAYRVQVAHEMEVLGLAWTALVCLVDGREPYVVIQDADAELARFIVAAEATFWERVCTDVAPALVGHADEAADLVKVWQPDPDESVELDDEASRAAVDLIGVKADQKELDGHELRLRAIIESAMGEATTATVGGVKVATWAGRTEVDAERLRTDHPDVYEQCLLPTFSAGALKDAAPHLAKDYRHTVGRTFRTVSPKGK